jgi:outer membrane receptor protein involved in Fe transport
MENNFNWDISTSIPFMFGQKRQQLLKAGYAGWNKDRFFFVLNSGSGGNGNGYYVPLRELYTPGYNYSFDFSRTFMDAYKVSLPLHAVYAMLDNRIGDKWRLVWGLRTEAYNIGRANQVIDKLEEQFGKDYSALRNREKTWQFFPSANLTYNLTSKMNLRLAYAKSIIRPDLRELAYFREYDYELGGSYLGGLVRSSILHHYDFRYEWYPSPGDILSASVFFKKLDYPMSIYLDQGSGTYSLTNDKEAQNYGFEVEARKSLGFTALPVLRHITLYGNFTYLDARVKQMTLTYDNTDPQKPVPVEKVYDTWEKRPQTGASNFMYNAGFYFDTKPVSVNLVYNVVTNRLFRPDVWFTEQFAI